MSYPNATEVCRAELFTKEVELRERYPGQMVEKVLRVREMYNWFIANPDGTDREFVAEVCQRHGIHRTTAYSDLAVVKSLLPMLGSAWHTRYRGRLYDYSHVGRTKKSGEAVDGPRRSL